MKQKKFLFLCFVHLLLMFILGVSPLGCEEQPPVLKIIVPRSNSALPLLLLAGQDPIPGVDIQTEMIISHAQALIALLRGDADLLLTGTSQGWENYLNGGPLLMVNTGVWGISYMVGRAGCEPIGGLKELSGKRIALPFPGSPLDFQTRYLLSKAGIDPDQDVKISYSPPPQTAALLAGGQIDAAPLPEPLASQLVVKQGLVRLLDYKRMWAEANGGDPRSPQVSLFALKAFAASHGQLLEELIQAWRKASQQVADDPNAAAGRYAEVLGFPEQVIRRSLGNTLFYIPSPEENRQRVQDYYGQVRAFLPGKRKELEADFFFVPQ